MEKILAWISVTSLGSLATRILPSEILWIAMQSLLGAACMWLSLRVLRRTNRALQPVWMNLKMKFSVIRYLFRRNSRLSSEVSSLRLEVKELDAQLKDIILTWSPIKKSAPQALSLGSKAAALGRLDFQEKNSETLSNEVFNESFHIENIL